MSLAIEANVKSGRTATALYFLRELGGPNAYRLLMAGQLADITVEYYL